ncbi:MAG: sulfoxide reductase heme-binding subunit YedZ [Anaerolineales bacterium]|nr:sulfoxide reductase heme-binding subunit YedZ [Anaerolineales bacterium]
MNRNTHKTEDILRHAAMLLPGVVLITSALFGPGSINPYQYLTQWFGRTAVILALISLSCTPLFRLTKSRLFPRLRRTAGLYTFGYAGAHFFVYAVLDYGLNISLLLSNITRQPFIILGSIALLGLTVLAVTSNKNVMRKFGRKWKPLHRSFYVIAVVIITHYYLATKGDKLIAILAGVVLAVLLIARPVLARVKQNR